MRMKANSIGGTLRKTLGGNRFEGFESVLAPNEYLIEYNIQLLLKGAQEVQTTRIGNVQRWEN